MTLDREPARKVVRERMRLWQTNAIANNVVWQFVNLALDAVEEQLAQGREHRHEYWVIEYHLDRKRRGSIVAVCLTRARARRQLKLLQAALDPERRNYTIHRVPEGGRENGR